MSASDTISGLLATVPAAITAGGPPWLVGLRREAAERLRTVGFPTRKTEAWRFTPVKPVVSVPFAPSAAPDTDWDALVSERLGDDGAFRVILVNGVPRPIGQPPEGVRVGPLSEVLARDPAAIEAHLGQIARSEYFGALNAALFEDGLVVRIAAGAAPEVPIQIVCVAAPGPEPTAAYPRILVVCDQGARAQLIECYLGPDNGAKHLTNVVTEVALGADARLDHLRVHHGWSGGYHAAALAVRQDRDSAYTSRVVALGGDWYRLDLDVALEGPGAEVHLDGVYHVTGREHIDHHVRVVHAAAHGSSNQHYRGLADGAGRAVFDGISVVRPGASQTSAHQQNHNLLLSDDAAVNTKPHLEIDTDELTASHGATIGALDDESLFYLRARGIGRAEAESILTFAFVEAILAEIPHEALRRRINRALLARLPHTAGLEELA